MIRAFTKEGDLIAEYQDVVPHLTLSFKRRLSKMRPITFVHTHYEIIEGKMKIVPYLVEDWEEGKPHEI